MLILDTDHFSELLRASAIGMALENKLIGQDAAVTIITLDEQARGWLARIKQAKASEDIVFGYGRLHHLFRAAAAWTVLPFDDDAASEFEKLKRKRLRIGTMDLRIASIAITTGGTVLTRNTKDFGLVPSLKFDDWLA